MLLWFHLKQFHLLSSVLLNVYQIAGSQEHGGDTESKRCHLCFCCQDNYHVWNGVFLSTWLMKVCDIIFWSCNLCTCRLADLQDFKKVNEIYAKCEFLMAYSCLLHGLFFIKFMGLCSRFIILYSISSCSAWSVIHKLSW